MAGWRAGYCAQDKHAVRLAVRYSIEFPSDDRMGLSFSLRNYIRFSVIGFLQDVDFGGHTGAGSGLRVA